MLFFDVSLVHLSSRQPDVSAGLASLLRVICPSWVTPIPAFSEKPSQGQHHFFLPWMQMVSRHWLDSDRLLLSLHSPQMPPSSQSGRGCWERRHSMVWTNSWLCWVLAKWYSRSQWAFLHLDFLPCPTDINSSLPSSKTHCLDGVYIGLNSNGRGGVPSPECRFCSWTQGRYSIKHPPMWNRLEMTGQG